MSEKIQLVTPRTPSGVMELLPAQQIAFQRFMETIRTTYERFGFVPVETPVFETTQVLLTKEGGETEKQVYFVQSTGARQQGHEPDMALRFDLTVPLARYVAEHEHNLNFPFRRYQMQKVYRGERAQKGRSREFYQCDIDVIGKDELSINYDAELPAIINNIFTEIGLTGFQIQINNRKLLKGLLESFGIVDAEKQTLALREIDKLDKIGKPEVITRLQTPEIALTADVATRLLDLMGDVRTNDQTLALLDSITNKTEQFVLGLAELKSVYNGLKALGVPDERVRLNLTTVRGLDYYTGTVYETLVLAHPEWGSVCSGGRYENLAGHYTKSKLPGVGISIGATRLFQLLMEFGMLKSETTSLTDVIIMQLDPELMPDYLKLASELRSHGLNVEVYLDAHKMGKQLKYADRTGAPYAVIMGSDEKARGTVMLKHLKVAQQEEVKLADVASYIQRSMKA